jgi:hypothetical protein
MFSMKIHLGDGHSGSGHSIHNLRNLDAQDRENQDPRNFKLKELAKQRARAHC